MSSLWANGIWRHLAGPSSFYSARAPAPDTQRLVLRRLPVHLHEMMSKAKKAERNLSEELAREPSRAEVAARAGLSETRLHALSRTYRLPSSMDAPLRQGTSGGDVRTLEDYVEDDTTVCSSPRILRFSVPDYEPGIVDGLAGASVSTSWPARYILIKICCAPQ